MRWPPLIEQQHLVPIHATLCVAKRALQIWEMEAQAEADAANNQADLVLLDAIDEHGYEAEDVTFAEELTQEAPFTPTAEDETKLKQYSLTPVPSVLKSEMSMYVRHRCTTFAAKRSGAAVVSATAEHDTQSLLKFYGWMARFGTVPQGALLHLSLLGMRQVGELAQQFCEWLVSNQQVRYTTVSNYLSGIISCMNYVYIQMDPAADVVALSPNPLEQVIKCARAIDRQGHLARPRPLFLC